MFNHHFLSCAKTDCIVVNEEKFRITTIYSSFNYNT